MSAKAKSLGAERARLVLQLVLGSTLLFSALAKLVDPVSFVTILHLYGVPLPGQTAAWVIALELVSGLLLVTGRHQRAVLGLTGALLAAYWAATLFDPRDLLRCGCFGTIGPRLTFGQHISLLAALTVFWAALLWHVPAERALLVKRRQQALAAVLLLATTAFSGISLSRAGAEVMQEVHPFEAIPVATLNGTPNTIDATGAPVLFFAWWCPHCELLMKQMARTPLPRRPVLVSTFFRSRDFAENRDRTLAELRKVGLAPEEGWTVYLDQSPKALVNAVPTLAYMDRGRWHVEAGVGIDALKAALGAAEP